MGGRGHGRHGHVIKVVVVIAATLLAWTNQPNTHQMQSRNVLPHTEREQRDGSKTRAQYTARHDTALHGTFVLGLGLQTLDTTRLTLVDARVQIRASCTFGGKCMWNVHITMHAK